ncbi:2'-5' RNA ligase family protein [Pedobacter sp. AW1-32]|uniref:2'-5' RNA ligase family protein n=1 Tax=Pedobacter sp. AW1-32 TaxID=3383026 RepID=UPI003FEDCE1C
MLTDNVRTLILTLRIEENAQQYFNNLRKLHFPPERNFLNAHLTLFHKLPDTLQTDRILSEFDFVPFTIEIGGLMNLGNGVAFKVNSTELMQLHTNLRSKFAGELSLQDQQGFRPHITIQNKANPEIARILIQDLEKQFIPFNAKVLGFDLWYYLDGPWAHKEYFPF